MFPATSTLAYSAEVPLVPLTDCVACATAINSTWLAPAIDEPGAIAIDSATSCNAPPPNVTSVATVIESVPPTPSIARDSSPDRGNDTLGIEPVVLQTRSIDASSGSVSRTSGSSPTVPPRLTCGNPLVNNARISKGSKVRGRRFPDPDRRPIFFVLRTRERCWFLMSNISASTRVTPTKEMSRTCRQLDQFCRRNDRAAS